MENMDMVLPELLATEWEGWFELAKAGTYQWVCFSVIDMWTQTESFEWNEKQVKKIRIGFEFADDDDNIKTIFKEFSVSFGSKAKLRQYIDAWNGWNTPMTNEEAKGFNVFTLLNKEATINIVVKKSKNNKEYNDIWGLSPRIKKIELHERKAKTHYLSLNEKFYNQETYDSQPQFIREKIELSPEFKKLFGITDIEEANAEFEKELETAEKGKTIEEIQQATAEAKANSDEVEESEAKKIFTSTETME